MIESVIRRNTTVDPEILAMAMRVEAEIERRHKEYLLEKWGAEEGERLWLSFQSDEDLPWEELHEDDPRRIVCGNCYLGASPITDEMLDGVSV